MIFLNGQATSSGSHDDYNRTFGVDGTFGLGRDFTFYSYLAKTDTPGLKGQDYAGRAFLDYNSDRWVVRGGYSLVQDNFYHGHLNDWITSGGFRVGEKFLFDLRYNLNDASGPWGSFRLHLIRLRSSYAFSPNKFVQALIQYNSRFHLISSNIRFGVVRQSGTGLFVVYNEQYETSHGGFPVLFRSLALKYSYLFNR